MQRLVWQNSNGEEINLTSGNYGITEWEGFSNASLNIQSQQVPFQDGGVFLDALIEQRELSVTLKMQDNGNLQERYRMRRELIHALNPKLGEGYLIYTNDFTSKRIKCVPQIPLFPTHNSNDSGTPSASLAWTACEPYWEDLEETTVVLNNGVITNIENEGDVDIGVKINANGSFDDFMIVNQENQKHINIKDSLSGNVKIKTLMGEKSANLSTENIVFKTGGIWKGCIIKNWDEYYCGYGIYKRYYDGKTKLFETSDLCNDITQSDNLIVACLHNKKIVYSSDEENWTEITYDVNYEFDRIEWNNGYFYAGDYYHQYRSTNLINWESSTFTFSDKYKVQTEDYYFRLADTGAQLYPNVTLQRSVDGLTWETIKILFEVSADCTIYFYNKKIIICCGYNTIIQSTDNCETLNYISGGIICTQIMASKKIGNKYYCLGGMGGFYTEDFKTLTEWGYLDLITYSSNVDFVEKEGLFIIVGYSESKLQILRSTDGINFTKTVFQYFPFSNNGRIHIFNNKFYIWCGQILLESTDGENWTEYEILINHETVKIADFVITPDNVFYTVDNERGYLYKVNFLTETEFTSVATLNFNVNGMAFHNNTLVCAGNKLFVFNMVSETGKVKNLTNVQNYEIRKIEYIDGAFYFAGLGLNGFFIDIENIMLYESYIIFKNNTFVKDGSDILFMGQDSAENYYVISDLQNIETNIINKLSNDSDMSLQLKVGDNNMLVLNNAESANVLSYRQKYIGV